MAYAGKTGDSAAFRKTFASTCTKCEAIASGIEDTYANGGKLIGGEWRPYEFKFYGIREGVGYVDAYVNYEPQTFIANASAKPRRFPARRDVLKAFQLTWDREWTVGALDPEL